MPARPSRISLRADALHNRHRILQAAREAFATRGLDVPMAAIARRAGVGVATLYRRFPTRESLVTEVFADQLTACAATVDDALADPDPWRAFPDAADHEERRARAERGLAEIIRRAKAAGKLRADFHQADLTMLLLANAGIAAEASQAAPAASRRLVAYLLQAFRADHADPLPPPPPLTLSDLYGRCRGAGRPGVTQ